MLIISLKDRFIFSIDESELSRYFTLDNTMNSMFKICGDLFDIDIKVYTIYVSFLLSNCLISFVPRSSFHTSFLVIS